MNFSKFDLTYGKVCDSSCWPVSMEIVKHRMEFNDILLLFVLSSPSHCHWEG